MTTALLVPPLWAQTSTGVGLSPARGWIITPSLTMAETYTDNVRLAPAGSQRTEWVTTITPTVSVTETGPRLRLNATYSPQLVYRANQETHSVFQAFTGAGNAELVRQVFYVDANASVSQTNASILGPQAGSNVYNTGNRTSVATVSVSPYVRHKFGNDAEGVARYTYSTVNFNAVDGGTTTPASNTHQSGINLRLSSGPAFKVYTWNVNYNEQTLSGSQGQGVTTQSLSAGGRRLLTYQLYFVTSFGYTKSDYQTVGGASNHGITSSYGLQWTPSPRTNVTATLGKSYYGDNRAFDLSYRTPRSVWNASYSETISSTHSQFASPSAVSTASLLDSLFAANFPDPLLRQQAIKTYIAQNGIPESTVISRELLSEQFFLSKRLSASAGILGRRNTVLASVFRQKSENQSTTTALNGAGDFTQSSTNTITGATLNWSSRLSPIANASVNGTYTRTELPGIGGGRVDSLKSVQVSLTRQFAKGQSGSLTYHKSQTNSNQSAASYAENAVTASIALRY